MTRLRASSIHLAISAVIGVSVFVILWFIWYPTPLLEAVGGTNLFLILLGVDICLGPLLTLIVFKQGKKTLKMDLTVIAALQVAALCYGIYTFYLGRPVHIASMGFRYDVIRAADIDEKSLSASGRTLPLFGPVWVGAKPPVDPVEQSKLAEKTMSGGADLGALPEYYVPLESMREAILKEAKSIDVLRQINKERLSEIDAWFASRGIDSKAVKFQPLRAPEKDMAVIIDPSTAKVLGIAPFYPWN